MTIHFRTFFISLIQSKLEYRSNPHLSDRIKSTIPNGIVLFMVEVATPDSNHPWKSEIKPCAIRDYPMLARRLFLNENAY